MTPPNETRFSLILATVGRTAEISRLLQSLAAQTYRQFELIVVDQNEDDRLADIVRPFKTIFPIEHLRCQRGLSRARNVGLAKAAGDVLAFPDDDCWYPDTLLGAVAALLNDHPQWDGLTGSAVDENHRPSVARWDTHAGPITPINVWRRACSITMFLRGPLAAKVGTFDETMGVGAGTAFGGGEETDYLLRAMAAGFALHYDPHVTVGHGATEHRYDANELARAYSYGMGHGRLLARHHLPLWFSLYTCLRPLGGAALSLLRGNTAKAKFHYRVHQGRLAGWLAPATNTPLPLGERVARRRRDG